MKISGNNNPFEAKFQRDLNRIIDAERNTRKRGLQKIFDDIPWNDASEDYATFVNETLLKLLIPTISDPIEKCRELTLNIIKKLFSNGNNLPRLDNPNDLVRKLCQRIGETPFPESAEELRLLVSEILSSLLQFFSAKNIIGEEISHINGIILEALCKALNDNFPAVKRSCAELISAITILSPKVVQLHLKSLLKGLSINVLHQHAKTRILTLQAIGDAITCATQAEYESLMNESILSLFSRLLSDRSSAVKVELGTQCGNILKHRFTIYKQAGMSLSSVDLEVMVILLLLNGDDQNDVSNTAKKYLEQVSAVWDKSFKYSKSAAQLDVQVSDGELELQKMQVTKEEGHASPVFTISELITDNFRELADLMIRGVDEWTSEIKTRYLKGLAKLIEYGGDSVTSLLPLFLSSLGSQIKDDDNDVRISSEKCCTLIGQQIRPSDVLEILMPRMLGEVPGGDTSGQRTSAIRVLTHILQGFPVYIAKAESDEGPAMAAAVAERIAVALGSSALYDFRDAVIREALLLLVRALSSSFASQCAALPTVQRGVALSLVYLAGKCPGEEDIVHEVARNELPKFAALLSAHGSATSVSQLLKTHFEFIFGNIIRVSVPLSSDGEVLKNLNPRWEARSSGKAAFEVLVRDCPGEAWARQRAVVPVFRNQVQPPVKPAAGTPEANALSYAAQRGEEVIPTSVNDHVDVRLSLLVLLEGFIRAGAEDWQCGRFIEEAAEGIVKEIIVPNLIWKIGRVEATVRKVALATAYGLLKAGAIKAETLARSASDLVPLVVSNLDDMESTPRQIACLCLTVLFERLRGAFGDNAVREMYPKLVARLDDSNDAVRVSVCKTLEMFLQCAHKSYFLGTTIDYILDQLFIHLDDPDPAIQEAVVPVIVVAANSIDKNLVIKKAENSKQSHRSPSLCNRILVEVQGFEILED